MVEPWLHEVLNLTITLELIVLLSYVPAVIAIGFFPLAVVLGWLATTETRSLTPEEWQEFTGRDWPGGKAG
jgi:hypothetical protein